MLKAGSSPQLDGEAIRGILNVTESTMSTVQRNSLNESSITDIRESNEPSSELELSKRRELKKEKRKAVAIKRSHPKEKDSYLDSDLNSEDSEETISEIELEDDSTSKMDDIIE